MDKYSKLLKIAGNYYNLTKKADAGMYSGTVGGAQKVLNNVYQLCDYLFDVSEIMRKCMRFEPEFAFDENKQMASAFNNVFSYAGMFTSASATTSEILKYVGSISSNVSNAQKILQSSEGDAKFSGLLQTKYSPETVSSITVKTNNVLNNLRKLCAGILTGTYTIQDVIVTPRQAPTFSAPRRISPVRPSAPKAPVARQSYDGPVARQGLQGPASLLDSEPDFRTPDERQVDLAKEYLGYAPKHEQTLPGPKANIRLPLPKDKPANVTTKKMNP